MDRHLKLGNSTCGASVHFGQLMYALEGVDCSVVSMLVSLEVVRDK